MATRRKLSVFPLAFTWDRATVRSRDTINKVSGYTSAKATDDQMEDEHAKAQASKDAMAAEYAGANRIAVVSMRNAQTLRTAQASAPQITENSTIARAGVTGTMDCQSRPSMVQRG
jgi:hypothetical protein